MSFTSQSPTPAPTSTDSPAPLSHDDRHYRPSDDRYVASSGRRYEQPTDASESRHGRHHSSGGARSPPRGRDHSRSPSPHGREPRARGSHRQAKGRANAKANGSQREHSTADLPKDEDRHWVPSPSSAPNSRAGGARRQNRPQNSSTSDRVADSEEAVQPPPQRETNTRVYSRDKDRTYASPPGNGISAPSTLLNHFHFPLHLVNAILAPVV